MRWRFAFLFAYFEHRSDVSTSVIFHSCASSVISSSTVTSILFTLPLNSAPALKRLTSFFLTFKIKSELGTSFVNYFFHDFLFLPWAHRSGRLNFCFL